MYESYLAVLCIATEPAEIASIEGVMYHAVHPVQSNLAACTTTCDILSTSLPLQAILRFFTTLAVTINQHRLSLLLQLRQQGRAVSQRCWATPLGRVVRHVIERLSQQRRRREAEAAAQVAAAALAAAAAGLAAAGLGGSEAGSGGAFGKQQSDGVEASVVAAAAAVAVAAGGGQSGQLQDGFLPDHFLSGLVTAPGSPMGQAMPDYGLSQHALHPDDAAVMQPSAVDAQPMRRRAAALYAADASQQVLMQGKVEPCYCPDCLAAAALQQAAQWQGGRGGCVGTGRRCNSGDAHESRVTCPTLDSQLDSCGMLLGQHLNASLLQEQQPNEGIQALFKPK